MFEYDVTLLTESKYVNIQNPNEFEGHILEDEALLRNALEARGLKVNRTNWDNVNFDWSKTRTALFRTIWDYFRRCDEFSAWLEKTSKITRFINPIETVRWNIDKHYLPELQKAGINIPPSVIVERGDKRTLTEIVGSEGWNDFILKPVISGAAWHTYKINQHEIDSYEPLYRELLNNQSMLLQEYQYNITTKGEAALMLFGGRFTHAVLKRVKEGDFRVQEDFGGTVHDYTPSPDEIKFAEKAVKSVSPLPVYGRVDIMWDNDDNVCLSELELIEPELWFRKHPPAAEMMADLVKTYIGNYTITKQTLSVGEGLEINLKLLL